MTDESRPNARADAERLERELFARLGLASGANSQEIVAAHDELVNFLAGAPFPVRGWAHRATAAADEAFALLSDPTSDLDALAAAQGPSSDSAMERGPEAARAGNSDEIEEDLEPPRSRLGVLKRLAAGAALMVAAITVAVVGYNLGGGAGVAAVSGTPAPSPAAGPSLDPTQVTALMHKIAADPQDVTALKELGDLYFSVGDYKTAADWITKLIAVDPEDTDALLALGAAQFNQGDPLNAEKQWRAVLAIDPNDIQAHYDLGFMYLDRNPPDMANVKLEWDQVIAIDPNSEIAQTVATHLKSLTGSPAPSAAAPSTPTASPAAGGQ